MLINVSAKTAFVNVDPMKRKKRKKCAWIIILKPFFAAQMLCVQINYTTSRSLQKRHTSHPPVNAAISYTHEYGRVMLSYRAFQIHLTSAMILILSYSLFLYFYFLSKYYHKTAALWFDKKNTMCDHFSSLWYFKVLIFLNGKQRSWYNIMKENINFVSLEISMFYVLCIIGPVVLKNVNSYKSGKKE